jgi:hypothetical protein
MAGNKNPWRDIVSPLEWLTISNNAAQARRKILGAQRGAAAAGGGGGGWAFAVRPGGAALATPDSALRDLGTQITLYDAIPKDDHTRFDERIAVLNTIHGGCQAYVQLLQRGHLPGAKSPGGKQLTDTIDVWVHSLGSRSLKKAGYLATMKNWHLSAKAKYKDKAQFSVFLRGLAADHTRGEKLHATPYATIEKIDPLHRQTFVFLDPLDANADQSVNEMGAAFLEYLNDLPASVPDRSTNANATFYEWLEYHPYCVGTPGVTAGADAYKDPATVTYENHDLGYVYMQPGQMQYERIISAPGVVQPLNTTDFGASGKGPPGAVAFVWAADGSLWLHEHGLDGFVHASAMQGSKIRCSGMLVVKNGKTTIITNQSGHYAPTAESIYYFARWLGGRNCLASNATVMIEHDQVLAKGTYPAGNFITWGARFGTPPLPTYP